MPSKEKVAKRYDRWSGVYDKIDTFPGANKYEKKWRMYSITSLRLNGEEGVLDIGTGSGLILPWIAELVPDGKVMGTDISEKMLDKANERIVSSGMNNIEVKLMDSEEMTFDDETFDRVIATFALTSFPDPQTAINEVARVLRKGGIFVILDTGKPRNPFLRLMFPMLRLTARTFGYTYIGRDIISMVRENTALQLTEDKRFFGGMVYCLTIRKQ